MLTQCPGCQTVFRITSAILRAAHGQVRCGRCNTQFDAIEYLQEEESADASAPNNDTPAEQVTAEFAPSFEPVALEHEEITLEGNRIEISGVYRKPEPVSAEPVEEHTRTIIEEFNIDTEEWQNPFAEPPSIDADTAAEAASAAELSEVLASLEPEEDKVPSAAPAAIEVTEADGEEIEIQFDPQLDAPTTAADVGAQSPSDDTAEPDAVGNDHVADADTSIVAARAAAAPATFGEFIETEARLRRWPWVAASVLLALFLVAQVLHHYRQTLVRHPTFGPQLARAYALFGQTLEPRWELGAYGIKQWGIVSDPQAPGTLRVRASIANNADFAQPYPLLKLTLEDRFGANLGMREFTPQEYLPNPAAATRRLPAGTAASVDLAIVDPGEDAVGFQFNVCLQRDNTVECAG